MGYNQGFHCNSTSFPHVLALLGQHSNLIFVFENHLDPTEPSSRLVLPLFQKI